MREVERVAKGSRSGWGVFGVVMAMVPGAALAAQEPGDGGASPGVAVAAPAEAEVRIDGFDLEPVWDRAVRFSGFRQHAPEQNADPSQRTEFRVAYDDANLYFFVRAFDTAPDSIMRALTRRDVRGPSDQISLYIDSYQDRRTGFNFHVNPDGVQRDHAIYGDGNRDGSWNGVWDVATQVDSLGWTAEFRIPLSQLRYADASEHTFGFGVWREIERHSETASWPLFSRTETGLMSQMGSLTGLTALGSSRRAELTPYALTRNVAQPGPGSSFDRNQEMQVGGDLKVGITPNVILDATVNPDFGQVEADPAVFEPHSLRGLPARAPPVLPRGHRSLRLPAELLYRGGLQHQ